MNVSGHGIGQSAGHKSAFSRSSTPRSCQTVVVLSSTILLTITDSKLNTRTAGVMRVCILKYYITTLSTYGEIIQIFMYVGEYDELGLMTLLPTCQ